MVRRAVPALGFVLILAGCVEPTVGDDELGETATGEGENGDSGDTTDTTTTEDDASTSETTTDETTETTGGDLPNGASCTSDGDCASGNCYVVPFLGGQCGECTEDADCADGGCTAPNPFEANGSTCNMGELGGGCETSDACQDGLVCGSVLDLLGLIQISTCGNCEGDADCSMGLICAPVVSVMDFSGVNDCIAPNSLPQDSYCLLAGNGNAACQSGVCSTVDIMALAEIGACGECNVDADCVGGTCVLGEFNIGTATLTGSTCQ
jgi:hypothetical protein